MRSADSRHILFVVGMHRSGTSALCAALHACGATFGDGLLDPMSDVNDRGFWESAAVVDMNDRLLAQAGCQWYSVAPVTLSLDWSSDEFAGVRDAAGALLDGGFGAGALEVVKDPRLCLTLPCWLALCEERGLRTSVCTVWRDPSEICQSLARRDGFPVGFSMRLWDIYRQGMQRAQVAGSLSVNYDRLLAAPVELLQAVAQHLPLEVDQERISAALDEKLRHHASGAGGNEMSDAGGPDIAGAQDIDAEFPAGDVIREFAGAFVERGQALTRIGEAHSAALAILQERDQQLTQRDAQIARLGELHSKALATVATRDAQIRDNDQRLASIGAEHSHALATINERDEQINEFDRRLAGLGAEHEEALEQLDKNSRQLEEYARRVDDYSQRLQKLTGYPLLGRIIRMLWNRA